MKSLIDQCVDDEIAEYLCQRGHECHKVRDISAPRAPDQLVAFIAESAGLLIITHDKHFKKIKSLISQHRQARTVNGAGVIWLNVREDKALERLQQHMAVIAALHLDSIERKYRMQIHISNSGFQSIDNAPPPHL